MRSTPIIQVCDLSDRKGLNDKMDNNIVDSLKVETGNGRNFYYDSNENANAIMRKSVECFLSGDKWRCEGISLHVIRTTLNPHAKGKTFGSNADLMNVVEKYTEYSYDKQRTHLAHLVNTFLLGLWIYTKNRDIKCRIDKEMETTIGTTQCFSGGDKAGEFLFRWRLAALSHDIGYIVSLPDYSERSEIESYLRDIGVIGENGEFDDLLELSNKEKSLDLLNGINNSTSIEEFYNKLREHPNNVSYDHGIMSALILLKQTNEVYKGYFEKSGDDLVKDGISYHPDNFYCSIANAAHAVAIHSLNSEIYEDIYNEIFNNKKIYDFKERPLAALLKLCDELQEWNKLPAKPDNNGEPNYTTPDEVVIEIENNKILIKKFPKKDELFCTLNEYFDHIDISCDSDEIEISFPRNDEPHGNA